MRKISIYGEKGEFVCGLTKKGQVALYNEKEGKWIKKEKTNYTEIQSAEGGKVYCLDAKGILFLLEMGGTIKEVEEEEEWKMIESPTFIQISSGKKENSFYGITEKNVLYKWDSSSQSFAEQENPYSLRFISGFSSSLFSGISNDGKVFLVKKEETSQSENLNESKKESENTPSSPSPSLRNSSQDSTSNNNSNNNYLSTSTVSNISLSESKIENVNSYHYFLKRSLHSLVSEKEIDLELFKIALINGHSPNIQDSTLSTPLHLAIRQKNYTIPFIQVKIF